MTVTKDLSRTAHLTESEVSSRVLCSMDSVLSIEVTNLTGAWGQVKRRKDQGADVLLNACA